MGIINTKAIIVGVRKKNSAGPAGVVLLWLFLFQKQIPSFYWKSQFP